MGKANLWFYRLHPKQQPQLTSQRGRAVTLQSSCGRKSDKFREDPMILQGLESALFSPSAPP